MSFFTMDVEQPYEEYVKTIMDHASAKVPRCDSAEQGAKLCEEVLRAAVKCEKEGHYDEALYYYIVAMQYFDRKKVLHNIRLAKPSLSDTFNRVFEHIQDLRKTNLHKTYDSNISRIRARRPEQERIVALQHLDDGENSSGDVAGHLQRQMAARQAEEARLASLRSQFLGGAPVAPIPDTPPPLYGNLGSSSQIGTPASNNNESNGGVPYTYNTPASTVRPAASTSNRPAGTLVFRKPPGGPKYPRRGIVNLGNTCYMNSILQLLNVSLIGSYFTQDYSKDLFETSGKYTQLTNAFTFVIRELRRSMTEPSSASYAVSASTLKTLIGSVYEPFDNNKQQDANELLHVLLDAIHTGLNANKNAKGDSSEIDNSRGSDNELAERYWSQYIQRNSSPIVEYCTHQERSMIQCRTCGYTSRSFNPSVGIELPIPTSKRVVTIQDCLDDYCATDVLQGSSAYKCSRCGKPVTAEKTTSFYSLPQVLFVTFKRFRGSFDFTNASKVTSPILFGEELDLAPYACTALKKTQYTLIGIVNHKGNMHGGHYTADVKGTDSCWVHASDEVISDVSQADHSQAYILCFARKP